MTIRPSGRLAGREDSTRPPYFKSNEVKEMAVSSTTLAAVKLALDVTVDDYDSEISDLIEAALLDMKSVGVDTDTMGEDKLVLQAVKTYCRMHFQSPADYDRLAASYDQQVTRLMHASGYTDYGEVTD